jgi:cyclic beta-1,2-glucan synthetase
MYRVGLEAILGFTKRGDTLTIAPRVPRHWPEFTIEYRFGRSLYVIAVRDPRRVGVAGAAAEVTVDGRTLDTPVIQLLDDGARHDVVVAVRSGAVVGAAVDAKT